ncbi:MAG: hypothetical protein GY696_08780, partial [Gammaproteobacteria bacterium]|nr:hypothetical protein [Gammaproteobacteria bacterium]
MLRLIRERGTARANGVPMRRLDTMQSPIHPAYPFKFTVGEVRCSSLYSMLMLVAGRGAKDFGGAASAFSIIAPGHEACTMESASMKIMGGDALNQLLDYTGYIHNEALAAVWMNEHLPAAENEYYLDKRFIYHLIAYRKQERLPMMLGPDPFHESAWDYNPEVLEETQIFGKLPPGDRCQIVCYNRLNVGLDAQYYDFPAIQQGFPRGRYARPQGHDVSGLALWGSMHSNPDVVARLAVHAHR